MTDRDFHPQDFHPLDPLTRDEFTAVVDILGTAHGVAAPEWRYASIEMAEPDKAALARYDADATVPERAAHVVCFERASNKTYKALVSLTDSTVTTWEHIPGVQANFTVDEWEEADAALRSHPDVIAALARLALKKQ